jgi:hypothetical protein
MTDNPYEPPQQENLSPVAIKAEISPREGDRAKINGRIVRRCFLFVTPLLFIFSGIFGAILNPTSIWSGNELGRAENFFIHGWPFEIPGMLNVLIWPFAFILVLIFSSIRQLMLSVIPFLIAIGLIGLGILIFGALARIGIQRPILLGDGCGIIFFAITTARAIRSCR